MFNIYFMKYLQKFNEALTERTFKITYFLRDNMLKTKLYAEIISDTEKNALKQFKEKFNNKGEYVVTDIVDITNNQVKKSRYNDNINDRYDINMGAFILAIDTLKNIMNNNIANDKNFNWATIGSFSSINHKLADIIEGYDENIAIKIREMLKH